MTGEILMPVTPLHYPAAYFISKSRKLSLPGLIVGSVIPDIEVPFMWIFFPSLPDHLFLHSLFGALVFGTLLAGLVTHFIYAPVMSTIFGIDQDSMDSECAFGKTLLLSCFIGVLSHLIIDYPMHPYNPLFWPFVDPNIFVGPFILLFMSMSNSMDTSYLYANSIFHVVFIFFFWGIYWINRSNPRKWEIMWLGDDEVNQYKSKYL